MILVAGGELDFNLGALLQRMLRRRVKFKSVLLGAEHIPRLTIDIDKDRLRLDGKAVRPTACFMRHDVFLMQTLRTAEANAAALNWYATIKGWELAHDDVRGFNKTAPNADSNKLSNLYLAGRHGLKVPRTLLTNEFALARKAMRGPLIEKPSAGGELTGAFDALGARLSAGTPVGRYPRFVQQRMRRPELRVFRVGDELLGYSLTSPDLDYRAALRSRLKPARVPAALGDKYHALCSAIGLDFAAADFMRDPRGGEHCFLEVNSQPMFAAFDAVSGGRLCDVIIDHLSGRAKTSA
jgi:glutathione synthase/RimK-type ligase-like ATP-grasp enzyme